MSIRATLASGALLLAVCALMGGCLPSARGISEEEKEAHFLEGKSRVKTLDFSGAIDAFEKAIEANPQSGGAHFELACILEKRQADPAAAIYHFQQYLRLRPKADNREIIQEHIMACKQELARTVSLGPVAERQQREFEQLLAQNKKLREDLDKWRGYATRLQALTNQTAAFTSVSVVQSSLVAGQPVAKTQPIILTATNPRPDGRPSSPVPVTARTHTITTGETPTVIARRYGIKVATLMAANPQLDARRLQPGQTLAVPLPASP